MKNLKKRIVLGSLIAVVLLVVALTASSVFAADGSNSWWWVNGQEVETITTKLDTQEPFGIGTVSGPAAKSTWYPGETREWIFDCTNQATVALPAVLNVQSTGSWLGSAATVDFAINDAPAGTMLLYGNNPYCPFQLPSTTISPNVPLRIKVLIKMDEQAPGEGAPELTFRLYRGVIQESTYTY